MDQDLKSIYRIHTFGCKVNTYDSGLIEKNLNQNPSLLTGLSDLKSKVHILNTCAVTAEATKEAVRSIRRLKAQDPLATVVVTGCAAQVDTDAFANLPGADLIVANSHKGQLPQLIEKHLKGLLTEKVFKSNIFKKEDLEAGGGLESRHTRSFLKIQDGCNSFCTYCVIPYARGKSRSLSVNVLIDKINQLYAQGIQEVVLTGVHIGDYEEEWNGRVLHLEGLVEQLLKHTQMPRFRLSSLEPVEVSDKLLELYQDSRLCPHFHMSIQSANTDVLFHMKRKYTQMDVIQSLNKIYKKIPDVHIGMDVIVGFPTETEEQFMDTYQVLHDHPWTKIHVFPYSERPGTRAASYTESVVQSERVRRAGLLRSLSQHRYQQEAKKQVGLVKKVLLHKKSTSSALDNKKDYQGKKSHGLSRDYWSVRLAESATAKMPVETLDQIWGKEVDVKMLSYEPLVTGVGEGYFLGDFV